VPSLRPELEPPPGYVEFVARNLELVREEATRLLGDEQAADRLYPDALTDVAVWWGWLELQRRWLRRRSAAQEHLSRALTRRWQAGQRWEPEEDPADTLDIRVLTPGELPWRAPGPPVRRAGSRVSAAVRLAPQLQPAGRPALEPVADAAIAWWHAYERWRRRRRAVAAVVAALLVVAAVRWHSHHV